MTTADWRILAAFVLFWLILAPLMALVDRRGGGCLPDHLYVTPIFPLCIGFLIGTVFFAFCGVLTAIAGWYDPDEFALGYLFIVGYTTSISLLLFWWPLAIIPKALTRQKFTLHP